MSQAIKTKDNKLIEILIGILLIIPIYMLIFIILNLLNLNNGNNRILLPILMYVPLIIGIALSYKFFKNKISKLISFGIITFLTFAIFCYYNTYFVEYSGWDGIGYYFLWFINTCICKILSCIFYGKIVGWKKSLIFLGIYILSVITSFALGFWT